ncbi:sensor histidine kinase [Jeotgalibacillus campisalis]|uniref:Histidine kinase n=1 Tax=Jeotgalibacillus campisalis TaxID=220754 RepID=A0A0C2SAU9_9BACL|nr:sensor histidine kinase [Jeotgalibacillus campisalis]KIL51059.1 histidine kinase [Jeotgalibacillus campisalis]
MIKKGMYKHRFATKVVAIILVCSLIPTFFTSVFYYISSSNIVKENVRDSSLQISQQAADSLSYILATGSDMSDLVYSNERIQEVVVEDVDENLPFVTRQENNEYLSSFLNSNVYSSSFVKAIYILKQDGRSWGSGTFSEYKFSQYELSDLYWPEEATELDGEIVWTNLQLDLFRGAGENTEYVLPISRVMKDFTDLSTIAYVQVLLDGDAIIDKINEIKLGETGRFFVVDSEGKVMIDSKTDRIGSLIRNQELRLAALNTYETEFEFELEGTAYYGVKQTVANGWTVVGTVPIEEITGELLSIQYIVILSSLFFSIIAIMIGLFVARKVTEPVKTLTYQMKRVGKGDLNARTSVQTSDEIGEMSMEFNRMIEQIDQLVVQVKTEQVQKKEAELRAIKHRINPHFLFNTLSTIKWLLTFKQFDRANVALTSLNRLLEANMGKKGTFVTIAEEIDIVEKFIDIMKIRYEQEFHLILDLEESVKAFHVPQMLLQPIVENAIFHGIVPKGVEGTVLITGRSIEKGIRLTVQDDGMGMSEESLNAINHAVQTKSKSLGIGLLHVVDSIDLYFAPESTVMINSDAKGTTLSITLIQKNGEGNHV